MKRATLTVCEMAEIIGISRTLAYSLANDPSFYPAFRIGRKQLIDAEKLRMWIDQQTKRKEA